MSWACASARWVGQAPAARRRYWEPAAAVTAVQRCPATGSDGPRAASAGASSPGEGSMEGRSSVRCMACARDFKRDSRAHDDDELIHLSLVHGACLSPGSRPPACRQNCMRHASILDHTLLHATGLTSGSHPPAFHQVRMGSAGAWSDKFHCPWPFEHGCNQVRNPPAHLDAIRCAAPAHHRRVSPCHRVSLISLITSS